MNTELIIIREYCIQSRIEPDFIVQLENEGLIEVTIVNNERYLHISQLSDVEQYARWHYDLSINVEGIDVIRNLLGRIHDMRAEITQLKAQLRLID
ncbi:chaperone modulatory protein CbpM [Dysgonomonas sp. PFB1-18]|uniref:chaperone modulator CbpM n=1 Tax=unclassified Dysgonomonas TaxID=2630389 RepID=UPI0024735A01|nr:MULTISPECIES: chaperone modulator CbpM [unclassified Dysgonomonas]MDH6307204.1 chaperone modulatory protein CbpM [Dysgonomonas sp. PF1-14]MDH6337123.1 chaperone modulatory protein CbpM [Dysgonomonas sp. PF1-16]MDH6381109.1 chaperone modulatory protein CbpM [Dysgonomonas sp. PFB1-18]MDH6396312.1 chaperone modulatory protein CbpM [Dysgonomonas sp. PF1-23]